MNGPNEHTSFTNEQSGQRNATGKKNVLVTGGTGFLGAYIIKNLIEKGYSVSALRRSNKLPFFLPPFITEKVKWINGDVLDVVSLSEGMQNIDSVIHSAAVVSFAKKRPPENVPGKC